MWIKVKISIGKLLKKFFGLFVVLCVICYSVIGGGVLTNKAYAASGQITGSAGQIWVGFGDASNPNNSGYITSTDWITPNGTTLRTNQSYYAVNNLSATAPIAITSTNISNGTLLFSGTVKLSVRVAYAYNNYADFVGLGTSYRRFNSSSFGIGIDTNKGVYDATITQSNVSCSTRPTSTTAPYATYMDTECTIAFEAKYDSWSRTGNYQLNWRLNGNSATNGGAGALWAGAAYLGTSNQILDVSLKAGTIDTFDITFGDPKPTEPDYSGALEGIGNQIGDLNEAQQNHWQQEENAANDALNADNGAPDMSETENQANGYFDIFTAIFNTSQGNCTLPEISAFGFSLGQLDLCYYKPPDWLRGGLGAVATIATAWCGILVIRRIVEVAIGGIIR